MIRSIDMLPMATLLATFCFLRMVGLLLDVYFTDWLVGHGFVISGMFVRGRGNGEKTKIIKLFTCFSSLLFVYFVILSASGMFRPTSPGWAIFRTFV